MTIKKGIISACSLLLISSKVWACVTCSCSLSSDAALGYSSANGGWDISLDYSYINQNQLRHGTGTVSSSQVQAIQDQEVENQTQSRYLTLGIGYSLNQNWNFKLLAPYVERSHSTYGTTATLPLTSDQLSSASVASLGDIKFITSYQGFLPEKNLGIQVGIKLPTGNYGGPNSSNTNNVVGQGFVGRNPVAFGASGNAGSSYLDTSLQAGSGSTDLILGAYYFQPVSQDFDAFINGAFQFAMNHKLDQQDEDFRPGNQLSMNFGLRYEAYSQVVPQLQFNLTHRSADQGALADTQNSAGTMAYLSPGLLLALMKDTQLYAFIQVPVYSNLEGYQLFPRYTASVGINHHFN